VSNQATLKISNVGGLDGERTFHLQKNTLCILEGANAKGKSSIAKAMAAVLGIDYKVLQDSYGNIWRLEATNLGILPESGGHRAGIVHANATKAEVELVDGNSVRKIVIDRNGKIEPDEHANSNFLLTSVLTPNSWIFRAISSPSEIRNESIFKNYITKLSAKSDKYEKAGNLLQEVYSDLHKMLNEIKRKKAMIPNLKKEIKQLKTEIEELKKKKDELIEMIDSDSEQKRQEISTLKKNLAELEKTKNSLLAEIRNGENKLIRLNKELEAFESRIKELQLEKEKLKKREKEIEEELFKPVDLSKFEEEQKRLQDERMKLQALADLYYIALDSVNSGESKCPLCETGHVTKEQLEAHLKTVKENITKIEDELRKIVKHKENLEVHRKRLEKELEEVKGKSRKIAKDLSTTAYKIKQCKNNITKFTEELEQKKALLDKISAKIEELNNILVKENPELIEEISKISKTLEEREELRKRKESEYVTAGYVEVYGKTMELDDAIKVIEKAIDGVNKAKKYSLEMAEKIRREAVKQFNYMMQDVLKRTGFSEFKRIYLDRNYILNVQYVSPEGEVKVIQPYALSESERVTIALVFMLALNKVYREGIDYIVIDNMYEYFDEYRTEEILKVLLEYANKENVTILLTKTTYEGEDLRITALEGESSNGA